MVILYALESFEFPISQDLETNFIFEIGPNELSVFHPDILFAIDGKGNDCSKAPWYDLLLPQIALSTVRDKLQHDQRRRVWDHAFSITALRSYEDRCIKYATQLDNYLESTSNQPVLVNDCFFWFSFDIMGDLAMSRSFNMLSERGWHHIVFMMREFLGPVGIISPVVWLARLGFYIPGAMPEWDRFIDFCKKRMSERLSVRNTPTVLDALLFIANFV